MVIQSGQISIGDLEGDSLTKPPFKVTSAEVVILCPDSITSCNRNQVNQSELTMTTGKVKLKKLPPMSTCQMWFPMFPFTCWIYTYNKKGRHSSGKVFFRCG